MGDDKLKEILVETEHLKGLNHHTSTEKLRLTYLSQCDPVDIEFHDLCYTVPMGKKGPKQILHSINGQFKSGQLVAIMGPSGAGKSTLLNILAAYKISGSTGTVLVNGEHRNIRNFRKMSRYIMQQDVLQPLLSVEELMQLAADLKLGRHTSREQKTIVINEIINLLNLTKTMNTRTELLSGGEKKRLSIALELINNPPVLFLDEPTTGLDDMSSMQCVQLLKTLAEGGRTIICSIHTPSAKLFATFDRVYVLAEGYCMYQGYGPDCVQYLYNCGLQCPKHFNPADFIIEVCSGDYGDHINVLVDASNNGRNISNCKRNILSVNNDIKQEITQRDCIYNSTTMPIERSSVLAQFWILLNRMWLQMYRDNSFLILRFVVTIFIALMMGNLFLGMGHDGSKTIFIFGFYYMCIIMYLYIPMMPVLYSFPKEIQMVKRETFNKWYRLTPYFFAMTISTIPMTLMLGMIFIPISFTLIDQPMELDRMAQFYCICMLTALVSESIGLVISSHCNIVNSMFLGPVVAVPLMLLAVYGMGYGPDTEVPIFMQIIMHFSYLRYALEGLMSAMARNRGLLKCPDEEELCFFLNLDNFASFINVPTNKYWIDVMALAGMFFFFRFVCFYLLTQRLRPSKPFRTAKFLFKTAMTHLSN